MIGKTLAHYEVTALLGKGGMGEVYRATDTKLGREVALKLLPADLADNPERLARFRREARTLASLHHARIDLTPWNVPKSRVCLPASTSPGSRRRQY